MGNTAQSCGKADTKQCVQYLKGENNDDGEAVYKVYIKQNNTAVKCGTNVSFKNESYMAQCSNCKHQSVMCIDQSNGHVNEYKV